jgi:phosphoribosylanthranilate isomerase
LRKQVEYGRDGSKCQCFYGSTPANSSQRGKGARMIVQIYEIQTPREADAIMALGVDHVGSVLLDEQKWANETLKSTIELVQKSGRKSSLIPLFRSADSISRVADYYRPDILHFCETLPAFPDDERMLGALLDCQETIQQRFPQIDLMRSVPIGGAGQAQFYPSLALAAAFEPISDWFLTDTLLGATANAVSEEQPVNGFVGITGKTCDWTVAGQLVANSSIPVILAGGIGPGNVESAILEVKPAGVDSCTLTNAVAEGGEPIRFQKDLQKIDAMVSAARRAAAQLAVRRQYP